MSGLVESFAPPSKKSEVGQMSFSPTNALQLLLEEVFPGQMEFFHRALALLEVLPRLNVPTAIHVNPRGICSKK